MKKMRGTNRATLRRNSCGGSAGWGGSVGSTGRGGRATSFRYGTTQRIGPVERERERERETAAGRAAAVGSPWRKMIENPGMVFIWANVFYLSPQSLTALQQFRFCDDLWTRDLEGVGLLKNKLRLSLVYFCCQHRSLRSERRTCCAFK